MSAPALVEELKRGLDAPICLTWELTYACNLQCVHCLSSSGRRDPRELSTSEARQVLNELRDQGLIGLDDPMVNFLIRSPLAHEIVYDSEMRRKIVKEQLESRLR